MTFADLAIQDFLTIARGEFGEEIEYEEVTAAGAAPWRRISAKVTRGTASTPLEIGTVARRGPEPAEVRIAKHPTDGVAQVNPGRDHVRLNPGTPQERIYLVSAILGQHPGAWRIYACP